MEKKPSLQNRPTDIEVELAMAEWYAEILPKPPLGIEYHPMEKEVAGREKTAEVEANEPQPIPKSEPEANAWAILTLLFRNPFLRWGEILSETHLTDAKATKARAWLEQHKMAVAQSVKIIGRPGLYIEVMPWVYRKYGKKPPEGRGGFEHKCLCHYLKSWLEERGFRTWFEALIDGMKGSFDLFAWIEGSKGEMYGFEVTISFGNLLDNIRDGLNSKVRKLYIVCRDQADTNKARNIAKKNIPDLERLEFRSISEFKAKKGRLD